MTTHVFAQMIIKDHDALARYRDKAGAALARHGGSVVSAGPVATVLEAAGAAPDTVALLSFPSTDAAEAWRNDPDLADVHALRNKAGASTIIVVPSA